jgi:hypothetical protein
MTEPVNQPETELTPPLEPEDTSFLDYILTEYTMEELPKLDIDIFRNRYLPYLAGDLDARDSVAALRMWEAEVSKNARRPVLIIDKDGKHLYTVPPITGTVQTRQTGNPQSIESRTRMMQAQMNRLVSFGVRAQKEMFNNLAQGDAQQKQWALDWYKILKDFGYLDGKPKTSIPGPGSKAATVVQAESYDMGDVDFVADDF